LNHHRDITPRQKHGLYRTLVACLYLADENDCNAFKGGKCLPIKEIRNVLKKSAIFAYFL